MPDPRYDVIAIGNAIVDVMAPCSDELIEELGMTRGGMQLIDASQADELYDAMGPAKEISGGSAANTLAGLSAMGAQCAFVGQVADDQLGKVFAHDIRAVGVDQRHPALGHSQLVDQLVRSGGHYVDNGVADGDYVVSGGGHAVS